VRFGCRGVADDDNNCLGLVGELAAEPLVGVLIAEDPAAPREWNTTGSTPVMLAGETIQMLTSPVGPPGITRSSIWAGGSSTGTLT
jgi:hypothetical protein